MRRRRQQKLERRLQQFRSKDGGPDTGGTLKIYGESLCRDVPYKTLLLSVRDPAHHVVREMLAKYGLDRETDPHAFCLVQVIFSFPFTYYFPYVYLLYLVTDCKTIIFLKFRVQMVNLLTRGWYSLNIYL